MRTQRRLAATFTHIRDELGDFPGRIVDTARLRAMLANAARTYYPGVLAGRNAPPTQVADDAAA